MTIVPLCFNERVVYQQGRSLQVLSLACIAGEGPSVNSSKQIARLRIADRGFRHDKRDRAVSVKAASRQGSDWRFRRDANNQTNDGGGNGSIFKSGNAILIRPHTGIELLGCRIVRMRRVRVPDHPPPTVRRYRTETRHLHLEH